MYIDNMLTGIVVGVIPSQSVLVFHLLSVLASDILKNPSMWSAIKEPWYRPSYKGDINQL